MFVNSDPFTFFNNIWIDVVLETASELFTLLERQLILICAIKFNLLNIDLKFLNSLQ